MFNLKKIKLNNVYSFEKYTEKFNKFPEIKLLSLNKNIIKLIYAYSYENIFYNFFIVANKKGIITNNYGPSFFGPNVVLYSKNGLLSNDYGPSAIVELPELKLYIYSNNGILNREEGPAYFEYNTKLNLVNVLYYKNGQEYREELPSKFFITNDDIIINYNKNL